MRAGKSTFISWLVIGGAVIVALGALLFLQPGPRVPEAVKPPTAVPPTEAVQKPQKGFAKPVLSEEEKAQQDTESLSKALRSGTSCDEIEFDNELKQTCLDAQLYDSALIRSDENLCKQISDEKVRQDCLDHVYSALATQSLDKTLCEKIKNIEIKTQCADRILSTMGRTAKSADTCKTITDEKLRQDCLDNFNFGDSIQNLDEKGCSTIQNSDLKNRCAKTIAKNKEVIQMAQMQAAAPPKTSEEKLRDCGSLSGKQATDCKNLAYFGQALEKKDMTYCQSITDADLQKRCVDSVSGSMNNYYLRLATAKKDASLCSKILDASLRSTCLEFAK